MTANVLQREVDQVCIRVNTNSVSVRHEELAFTHQGLSLFSKDGDMPRFSRDIQQFQTGVECEDIRVFSDRIDRQHLHVRQVYDRELVILFSGNKRKSFRHIKRHTVRMSIPVTELRPMIFAVEGSIDTSSFFS